MQFSVSPKFNFDFSAMSVSLLLYANSGSGMKANVYYSLDSTFSSKTQIGTTLTLASTAPSSPNVTGSLNLKISTGKTLYLRLYPWYSSATTGKYVVINSVTVSGTTVNTTAPLVVAAVTDLPTFGLVVAGSASPAASFVVSATNLVDNVLVAAPAGFQVSKDSATYAASVSLVPSGGTVATTTLFARFSPSSAVGSVNDSIAITSSGATRKIIFVAGTAIAQEPSTQSSISFGAVSGTSIVVHFSGGNGNRRAVFARKDTTVSIVPFDGSGISGVNADYSAATDHGGGNKAVFSDTGLTVTVTGLSSGTKYCFTVFEFNIGDGNSQNYNTISPGVANQTTLQVAGFSVSPSLLSFGSIAVNTSSSEKSYSLSGNYLTPASGAITVTAPTGFLVSKTSGSGFNSSATFSYSGQTLNSTPVYVRFSPIAETSYVGAITNAGGGAATISVSVAGNGVAEGILPDSIPIGFASVGAGTTGGAGGTTVVITSGQQLADLLKPREKTSDPRLPVILYVSGTITFPTDEINIKRTSNVSVIGIGNGAVFSGTGIKMVESSNIIVRNITFSDCTAGEGDGMSLEGCNNVWVDHCSFTDSPSIDLNGDNHDGELDVKKESYNVTISWNHMMNHRKTCLMGHSVSETGDTSLKVTYYRNWFDGTYSRHPRVRYGSAHLLNNLYTNVGVGGGYGVGITCGAKVLVEANFFENTSTPILISQVNDPEGTLSGDPAGFVKASDNYLTGSGSTVENLGGYNFNPADFYTYTPGDPQKIKAIVMAGAGAGTPSFPMSVREEMHAGVPASFELSQNYPNPFNPTTLIHFALPSASRVSLKVYSLLGQEVATLVDGVKSAGNFTVQFSARRGIASGMYLYRLEAAGKVAVKKMLILK